MNRQEAIVQLKEWLARAALQGLIPGDVVAGELQKIVKAFSGPTPDPDTGLVPCGCGGKAGFHYSVMMRDNDCYVECGICGGHTKVVLSEDKARDAWNTAMGWKGGAK